MSKIIKLFLITFILSMSLVLIVSCDKNEEKVINKPVFTGVDDVTIEKGSTFVPLEGVTVTDVEDGSINVASKSVVVNARSLNINVEGTYDVIYTAYDSDGNETTVIRKVTVVYKDVQAPDLYGVTDTDVVIGDPSFTTLKDVTAIDTIDGDLTSTIKVEGTVDVWTLGEYQVKYSVTDKSNNAKEVTRKINVTLGNFSFDDNTSEVVEITNQKGTLTGGNIMTTIADYSLVKLSIKMSATTDTEVEVKIQGATTNPTKTIVKEEKVYDFYARISEVLNNAEAEIVGDVNIQEVKVCYAVSGDTKAPVITRKYEKDIVLPVGMTKDEIQTEILRGVTAEDEIEGNVTSLLTVDYKGLDLTKVGEGMVEIIAKDSSGNTSKQEVKLTIAKVHDTAWFTDSTFDDTTTSQIVLSSGGGGQVTMEIKDGMLQVNTVVAGGWASADSPYLKGLTTSVAQAGYTYMLSFDVKADKARSMCIRAGLELWESPWMEDFYDSNGLKYSITTDWQTINFIFYVPSATSGCGSTNIKCELQLGSIDWNDNESGNITYFDNMHLYLLSNESNAPVITEKPGIVTTYAVGDALPDFTTFITATDVEDGDITITSAMVDATKVDMNKAGKYKVSYKVTDSDKEEATYEIEIEVLASKDTTGPVIALNPTLTGLLQQLLPLKEGFDLSSKLDTILANIIIVDDVDGTIPATVDMIDLDGLSLSSANTGTHNLKIQCKDSSGNLSNEVTIEIKVVDATAPKLVGVRNYTVVKGTTINPLAGVQAWDSTDGVIDLTLADLVGFDAFLDATGKVIGAAKDYQVSYKVSDQAGNLVENNAVITVTENSVTYNDNNTLDLLSQKVSLEGTKSKATYDANNTATVTYVNGDAWWASQVKFKYTGISLEKGVTYKFVFEVEATTPREMLLSFFDSSSNKVPGWENADTYNRICVGLTTHSYIFEKEFTVTDDLTGLTLEVQFGWEQNLINSGNDNTITIKQIKLLSSSTKQEQQEEDDLGTPVHTWAWADGTRDQPYTSANWKQQKIENGNLVAMSSSQMNCRMCDSTKVVNFVGGYSQVRYFTYTNGNTLGTANTLTVELGNYFSPKKPIQYKIVIIDKDDNEIYLKGTKDSYETFNTTNEFELEKLTLSFEEVEVKAIRFIVYSSENSNQYLYCGPIKLYDLVK